MTKMVRSVSSRKRFALQMSLEIKSIGKNDIRIRYLEKSEEELPLKFSSKNQKNPDAEFIFSQTYHC